MSSLPAELQARWAARQAEKIDELEDRRIEELPGNGESGDRETGDGESGRSEDEKSNARLDALATALGRSPLQERQAWIEEVARLHKIVEEFEGIKPRRVKSETTGKMETVKQVKVLCKRAALCEAVNPGAAVILAREPARAREVSVRTLDRWLADYKERGLVSFLRAKATPKADDPRRAKIHPDLLRWVNANWRSFRSPKAIYVAAKKKAKAMGWKEVPSQTWFYRHGWQAMPPMVKNHHLNGEKGHVGKFESYIERDFSDLEALEVLCGDHRISDVMVLLEDNRTAARVWTTLWQDLRSGLIWGRHLARTPSSLTIGYAYANGVRTWGAQPPARDGHQPSLYTDQGKDYRSKNFNGQVIAVHKEAFRIIGGMQLVKVERSIGFMNELALTHRLARGYNGREKPVERTNRDLSLWEANCPEFVGSWCSPNTTKKPDAFVKNWDLHSKFSKGKREKSPFITFAAYCTAVDAWIAEYNSTAHKRTVLGGKLIVPVEEFERLYTTRFELSEKAMAMLVMKGAAKVIGKNGVSVDGTPWHYFHRAMGGNNKGKYAEVRWDDADLSSVEVCLPDGQWITAGVVEKSSFNALNKDVAEMISKQKKSDRRVIREHNYLTQSIIRGETADDRAAEAMAEEQGY
ncbi:MAG TPA: hypothetical protein VI756_10945, partial [Blastocatellia bacterium]